MCKSFKKKHPWLFRSWMKTKWKLLSYFFRGQLLNLFLEDENFRIYLNIDDASSRSIYLGNFEKETLIFIKKILKENDCVIDIGANIGYYTIIFSKLIGKKGQVHVFEPSTRELQVLFENIKINKLTNIYLNHMAISNIVALRELNVMNIPSDGVYNSLQPMHHPSAINKDFSKQITRTIDLDTYISMYHQQPTLVKVDTEGAEFLVLQGGKVCLSSDSAPMLVIEECPANYLNFNVTVDDVQDLLSSYGYSCYRITADGNLVVWEPKKDLKYSENIVAAKPNHILFLPINQ